MLARDLAYGLDPPLFMSRCGLDADPWQARMLRSTSPQALLLCSRQAGKSTSTAALAIHTALYDPGSLTLLFAPSMRQSQELFRKVSEFYSTIDPMPLEQESMSRLELPNGSRVVSLPATPESIRGYSAPKLIIVDEAAFVEDGLYQAVRPMLAVSNGRLIGMSSAHGKRGWFYQAWTDGGPHWERIMVTAYDCPRITSEFLERERAAMPDAQFRQEYLCEFVDTNDAVFPSDLIRSALAPDVAPLFPSLAWAA
jgi:hypothetical protein